MERDKIEKLNWAFIVVSFSGFMDALYLSIQHFRGLPIICAILEGCNKVASSIYATILNIPVAYIGVAYYFLIFLLALWFLTSKNRNTFFLMSGLTVVGFLASVWFVYLQIFVIKAICFYCMISALTSTMLFILGSYYWVSYYSSEDEFPEAGIRKVGYRNKIKLKNQ